MIDFHLNGEPQSLDGLPPDTSVLELLRTRLDATGTKEGCASGDCGACTVAIGEPDGHGNLRYHSANACILPAHQLKGCHLVTVEGLAKGDVLHPAQAAMVDCHASQCGFCTPGIVMSLFTLYEASSHESGSQPATLAPYSQARLEAALGGNLCRCTGYRPIRDAAQAMLAYPADQRCVTWDASEHLAARVAESAQDSPVDGSLYHRPKSLAELFALRRDHPSARLVAGATDLWLERTQQLKVLPELIDLRNLAELQVLEEHDQGLHIGAAVTYARFEPVFEAHFPAFSRLLHRFASSQIRHRATLGGNVANASPIGDGPPVLLALDASLVLEGPEGARELPAQEFFLDYRQTALGAQEVLGEIRLPWLPEGRQLKVWKLSKRREDDISAVLGAFSWQLEEGRLRNVRLAFGGMAAIPARARGAEAALEDQPPSPAAFAAARQALDNDFKPLSDVRGSSAYRRLAAANLLERLRLKIVTSTSQGANTPNTPAMEVTLDAYAD
ncbi:MULTISPECIES: xanthine dehydrogenase small subunit [Halomonadaceae]|uniref:xanthine dehydrogenase small subunit n=1 Tax=Halomonadaceae TaxID=28256 RepID=UPI001581B605|nr:MULTISPECIES: xanthine dehydrogenase small subunit [Halomonas]MDI4638979.1 xanthine dehydrogenase small subunit [Halomonas sp. BMC7]NUJ59969.1 xanthine dehydrogenase small subunit [Halomonas taeanensis]